MLTTQLSSFLFLQQLSSSSSYLAITNGIVTTDSSYFSVSSKQSVSFMGQNIVVNNGYTATIVSFPYLTYTGSYINISSNNALNQILLPQLTYINGDLIITNCAVLTAISIPTLQYIQGMVSINANPMLSSMSAMSNLKIISSNVSVCNNNASLPVPSSLVSAASQSNSTCQIQTYTNISCAAPVSCIVPYIIHHARP